MCMYVTVCALYVYKLLFCNVCTLCTACSGGECCYAACLIVLIVCTSDKTYVRIILVCPSRYVNTLDCIVHISSDHNNTLISVLPGLSSSCYVWACTGMYIWTFVGVHLYTICHVSTVLIHVSSVSTRLCYVSTYKCTCTCIHVCCVLKSVHMCTYSMYVHMYDIIVFMYYMFICVICTSLNVCAVHMDCYD